MKKISCILVAVFFLIAFLPLPVHGDTPCTAPCDCLTEQMAAERFGTGNYVQCSRDVCGYVTLPTGARVPQSCFQPAASRAIIPVPTTTVPTTVSPQRVMPTTTQTASGLIAPPPTASPTPTPIAFPAITTPVNQIASAKPTTSPTPFQLPPTTPPGIASTPTPVPIGTPSKKGNEFTGTIHPLVISAGKFTYIPSLDTGSPYYSAQLSPNPNTVTFTFIETDWVDNNQRNYFFGEWKATPNWSDYTTLKIEKTEKEHYANFRYMTMEKTPTAVLWQVSRYPFANDPGHWQSQYVPGLVASGQVKEYYTDTDGFHYFRINFANIAKHNPGDPPFYVGTVSFEPDQMGQGVALQTAKIPFSSTGITTKKVYIGPFSVPVPVSLVTIPAGEFTQEQMGSPNENMTLSCTDCLHLRSPTLLETSMLDGDRKYYVRVIPIHEGGTAGIPAIPVEVTVHRPQPCPTVTQDITVKPPSARIVWYLQPTFGEYSYHYYYPWGDGFQPVGIHTFEPPSNDSDSDKAWYEKLIDGFKSVLNFMSWVVTQYSQLWNMMEDMVVKVVGDSLTLGWCSDNPECGVVLKTALQSVMAAYGIPPTLPTGPELMDISTDYMVRLGADQLGAGELYDAYQNLPQEGKDALQAIKGKAQQTAEKMAQSSKEQRDTELKKYRCFFDSKGYTCTNRLPDPIFSNVHSASVLVYVWNPNAIATDRVSLTVSDSRHLFYPGTSPIPPLQPGEGVSVPVVLTENYKQFRHENGGPCEWNGVTYTQSDSTSYINESYCLQGAWMGVFGAPGQDMFTVTFSTGQKSGPGAVPELGNLDAQSSGKPLTGIIVTDPNAGACVINKHVMYPQGWQITTQGESIEPDTWDYLFENGPNNYSKTSGMLRNK